MRTSGRLRVSPALIAVAVVFPCLVPVVGQTVGTGVAQERQSAEVVLARATEWLGGRSRIAAVKSLVVGGVRVREPESEEAESDPEGFKILLPDKYQSMRTAYRHTVNGSAFWMIENAGEIGITDDIRRSAEKTTRWRFVTDCLTFLMKVPDGIGVQMHYVGAVKGDADNYEWIDVSVPAASAGNFRLGFDRTTGEPRVIVVPGSLGESFRSLRDYKVVDGIRFPFTIDERTSETHSVTTLQSILVNSGVHVGDFIK